VKTEWQMLTVPKNSVDRSKPLCYAPKTDVRCGRDEEPAPMSSLLSRLAIIGGAAGLLASVGNGAFAAECNNANGCLGFADGMRVFANDPTVRGIIEYNERFIDLGTKPFNGTPCPYGVIRIGQNTNRTLDRGAEQDTGKKGGARRALFSGRSENCWATQCHERLRFAHW
jgi:hypothetical protein